MDPIQDKSIAKVTEPLKNMHFFSFDGHLFNFPLKKPSVELALLAIMEMWSPPFQVLTDADF